MVKEFLIFFDNVYWLSKRSRESFQEILDSNISIKERRKRSEFVNNIFCKRFERLDDDVF